MDEDKNFEIDFFTICKIENTDAIIGAGDDGGGHGGGGAITTLTI